MRKALILLSFTTLVGFGVWYMVRYLPLAEDGGASAPTTRLLAQVPPLGPACGRRCGIERWAVKTLSDIDRQHVRLEPIDATVEQVIQLRPGLAAGGSRARPVELTVYRITGYLASVSSQADSDWHLVIFGLQNERASLIAEIPDPFCEGACQSGFAEAFAEARRRLEEKLQEPNPLDKPVRIRVTGVGFFDREHGQFGAAPNQFELHPVLAVEFPDPGP